MIKLSTKWLALIGLAFFLSSCSKNEPELLKIQGKTMGTYYHITYVLDGEQSKSAALAAETLQSQIDIRLELVNDQMSTYRPDSELSRFNQAEKSLAVSDATRHVVEASLELFEKSNGAFDVTVGPLVNLWGFGPDKRPEKVPAQSVIEQKNQVVGSQHLSVSGNTLNKDIPELYVDLSSIAKGYGVDDIAEYLQSLGINNYLVDIGGELRVRGEKPGSENWTLAIERPSAGQNVQRLINIGDNAIATSGDYRNYYEFDDVRYSHTIDPATGKPIKHKLASVTVIHPSSMYADGLATVITVLGPEKGLAFAEAQQLAVFMLVKNGDDFIEYYTPEFETYFIEEK
ncbi:FAD:protein FMN transferase [Psychromonas ossibalaenae]|uniref:FAD:protein FMN transferase n=1 Tax=Psychromonas ossibalaenae TaxID=444922 RepID=UPI0003676D02|nr:FAD:protein FMN transferase [Psychromonas ossibalaenae]